LVSTRTSRSWKPPTTPWMTTSLRLILTATWCFSETSTVFSFRSSLGISRMAWAGQEGWHDCHSLICRCQVRNYHVAADAWASDLAKTWHLGFVLEGHVWFDQRSVGEGRRGTCGEEGLVTVEARTRSMLFEPFTLPAPIFEIAMVHIDTTRCAAVSDLLCSRRQLITAYGTVILNWLALFLQNSAEERWMCIKEAFVDAGDFLCPGNDDSCNPATISVALLACIGPQRSTYPTHDCWFLFWL